MKKCPTCRKGELESRRENHRYMSTMATPIVLVDIEVMTCSTCGERLVAIPRMEELHRVIAFAFAEQEARLAPDQIRFLRKYLGWSGVQFAGIMGVAPETVSRWENGTYQMSQATEKLLRALVERLRPVEEYPNEEFAHLANPDAQRRMLRLEATKSGWVEAHA